MSSRARTFIFDTASGKRIWRRRRDRIVARLSRRDVLTWGAEIIGVGLVAVAIGLWMPALGLGVVGAYIVLAANATGD